MNLALSTTFQVEEEEKKKNCASFLFRSIKVYVPKFAKKFLLTAVRGLRSRPAYA